LTIPKLQEYAAQVKQLMFGSSEDYKSEGSNFRDRSGHSRGADWKVTGATISGALTLHDDYREAIDDLERMSK
jgi:hypothetical protein